jgi:outer membrane lipoprotein-sorting protein
MPEMSDQLSSALRSGSASIVGHETINGADATGLTLTGGQQPSAGSVTMWFNSATYQLLRVDSTGPTAPQHTVIDYSWLARTPTALDVFRTQVPAGFVEQSPPPAG